MRLTSFFLLTSIVIFSFLSPSLNIAFAQELGNLRGFVTDSTNGEALAFGNVFIEEINQGASTNEIGMFLITLIPANKSYELTISYVGYKTKVISVFIEPDKLFGVALIVRP